MVHKKKTYENDYKPPSYDMTSYKKHKKHYDEPS